MIDRVGLADFLRRRRELLLPADVGLPDGVRRRTPGLRRDEVAQLVGISSDYYARLEQCRGPRPSESIVAALTRALRCNLDERDHLFYLAGLTPPTRRAGRSIRPGLISLAERLADIPVCICTDLDEVLWQNGLADIVLGRRSDDPGRARNNTWRWFTEPGARNLFPEEDWVRNSAAHVNELRATHARRAGEDDVASLVDDLLERSAEFRSLWERHEVAERRTYRKRILHPEVGVLDVTCEVLLTYEADLTLRAFFPVEGTDARAKLDLLRDARAQSPQSTD
ncbi:MULTISPECIES: helix-turn-helix transcriptional regulator [unclassified Streptomyces]|uniref:helix-turn-helix transcriptional regulator n=1 Tax=unclassified Streptomyces TaxID=2593676 RepID=UPI0033AD7E93